jgi:hypothetical protein
MNKMRENALEWANQRQAKVQVWQATFRSRESRSSRVGMAEIPPFTRSSFQGKIFGIQGYPGHEGKPFLSLGSFQGTFVSGHAIVFCVRSRRLVYFFPFSNYVRFRAYKLSFAKG